MTIESQSSNNIPSTRQQIAYSLATFGSSSLGAVVAAFAFFYYTTVVFNYTGEADKELIKSALIGFALALGWWSEAVANPLAGYISDKMPTRFGRRSIWLIFGSPVMALGFIGIFNYPGPAEIVTASIWLALCVIIYRAAYGATVCVYLSLMPEIASTPEARTAISSWRQFFYLLGTIFGTLIGALFSEELVFGYILAILMLITFYIAAFGSGETKEFTKQTSNYNILQEVIQTFQNKPFVPYVGYSLFTQMMSTILIGSLALFGTQIVFQGTDNILAGFLPAMFVITAIIAVFPAMIMIHRLGKRKSAMVSLLTIIVLLCGLFTVGMIPGFELIQTVILVLLIGFPAAPLLILPDAMMSDITDYDESVTGSRREAMHFASQGILTRFGGGFAIILMGLVLGFFGQNYGGTSAAQDLFPGVSGTLGLSLIGPLGAFFCLLALLSIYFYPEADVLDKTQ